VSTLLNELVQTAQGLYKNAFSEVVNFFVTKYAMAPLNKALASFVAASQPKCSATTKIKYQELINWNAEPVQIVANLVNQGFNTDVKTSKMG